MPLRTQPAAEQPAVNTTSSSAEPPSQSGNTSVPAEPSSRATTRGTRKLEQNRQLHREELERYTASDIFRDLVMDVMRELLYGPSALQNDNKAEAKAAVTELLTSDFLQPLIKNSLTEKFLKPIIQAALGKTTIPANVTALKQQMTNMNLMHVNLKAEVDNSDRKGAFDILLQELAEEIRARQLVEDKLQQAEDKLQQAENVVQQQGYMLQQQESDIRWMRQFFTAPPQGWSRQ
jgi:hypothetical protein